MFSPAGARLHRVPRCPLNDFILQAQQALIEDVQDLEKEIQLSPPFLYQGQYIIECILAHDPQKYDAYWYHPDHLGSSNYITNFNGNISQHLEYLPFGETLVEEHLNSYNSPYRFNGKELDAETGWYYYGARYYNPKWSIWLSVDPLAGKYPGWSPYNYTFQNPINFTDPDGREANPVYDSDGNYLGNTKEGFTGEAIIYDGDKDFSNMNKDELTSHGGTYYGTAKNQNCIDENAQDKILTNILEGYELPDGTVLNSKKNYDVQIGKDKAYSNAEYLGMENGKYVTEDQGLYSEYTVENIRATFGLHEIYGHGILDLGGGYTKGHLKIFLMEYKNSPLKVTDKWKLNSLFNIIHYFPVRGKAAPRKYYEKYLELGGEKTW